MTNKEIIKRLSSYVYKNNKFRIIVSVIAIFVSSIVTVISSLFLKTLIDEYILPLVNSGGNDFGPLIHLLTIMAVIYLLGVLSTYLYEFLLIYVTQDSLKGIRNQLFAHMQKLPIKYFDSHSHGDIMSVYTNDVDTLRQAISQSIPQMLSSLITIITIVLSMLYLSPLLSVLVFLMVGVMLLTIKLITGKAGQYYKQQQANLGAENGYIEEMLTGLKVVKSFVYEEEAKKKFDQLNEKLQLSSYRANAFSNVLGPMLGNFGNISYVLTAFIGSYLVLNNITALGLGSLIAFMQLNRSIAQPIGQISHQINSVISAIAGAGRIFELLDQVEEEDQGIVELVNYEKTDKGLVISNQDNGNYAWSHPHGDTYSLIPLKGKVEFHDVNFSYEENKQILHNINLTALPGQKVAFVGATGAGKTTITNLINRFYEIQSGSITYDGIDIKLIKKDSLRRSLGIVLQDTHLYSGTIAENIKYGKQDATLDEIIEAGHLSNVESFVKHLDDEYETVLSSSGAGLSNGQRQLISIARAALANAPVLILDEATSSIDSRTEKIVQDGMDKLMAGRTVFVIAHRLSTIVNSDLIMVMDQGRVIESGTHDDLLKLRGIYYQLYTGALEID